MLMGPILLGVLVVVCGVAAQDVMNGMFDPIAAKQVEMQADKPLQMAAPASRADMEMPEPTAKPTPQPQPTQRPRNEIISQFEQRMNDNQIVHELTAATFNSTVQGEKDILLMAYSAEGALCKFCPHFVGTFEKVAQKLHDDDWARELLIVASVQEEGLLKRMHLPQLPVVLWLPKRNDAKQLTFKVYPLHHMNIYTGEKVESSLLRWTMELLPKKVARSEAGQEDIIDSLAREENLDAHVASDSLLEGGLSSTHDVAPQPVSLVKGLNAANIDYEIVASDLTGNNFDADVDFEPHVPSSMQHSLVLFYAPWCPFCEKIAPVYDQVAAAAAAAWKQKVMVGKVNCEEEMQLCHSMGIANFPTIQFFPSNAKPPYKKSCARYSGSRNVQAMIHWLEQRQQAAPNNKDAEEEEENDLANKRAAGLTNLIQHEAWESCSIDERNKLVHHWE